MSRGYRWVKVDQKGWKLRLDFIWSSTYDFLLLFSDRDSYGGGREPRSYMDRPSGGSYRDSYDGYGKLWLPLVQDLTPMAQGRAAKITDQITALTTVISGHMMLQFSLPKGNRICRNTVLQSMLHIFNAIKNLYPFGISAETRNSIVTTSVHIAVAFRKRINVCGNIMQNI